jgi:hypothetical protein
MEPVVMATMKPGQTLQCTITKAPRNAAGRKTIARLMRQDPSIKKALKRAQERRMSELFVRSRGKRPWAVRETAARYAIVEAGQTWTMRWIPQLQSDLDSVADYIDIKSA